MALLKVQGLKKHFDVKTPSVVDARPSRLLMV